jgi:hypothetical protein
MKELRNLRDARLSIMVVDGISANLLDHLCAELDRKLHEKLWNQINRNLTEEVRDWDWVANQIVQAT